MATIRIRDWTKERIEAIRDAESHSSHDSVVKTLLKDRQLAQCADQTATTKPEATATDARPAADGQFDDLTVLAELQRPLTGVLFLWCPSCGRELAHVGFDDPMAMTVFEIECQRCLTRLDQHAIIGIEVGYPIEKSQVDGTLETDLMECAIDYWDRVRQRMAEGTTVSQSFSTEEMVYRFGQYVREFDWDWPADVPVVGVESGQRYRNDDTGEHIEVIEPVEETREGLSDYRVQTTGGGESDDGQPGTLTATEIVDLVLDRHLYTVDDRSEDI